MRFVAHDALMLYYDEPPSQQLLDRIQSDYRVLKEMPYLIDIVPSYTTILLRFDFLKCLPEQFKKLAKSHLAKATLQSRKPKLHTIYVDYEKGLDLERIARLNRTDVKEVVRIHTQTTYRIYAIGFLEGFAYMGTLDPRIATPRLERPRAEVAPGSVAIAHTQTAIYPKRSIGGWNIVGHSEFDDFEAFEIGDRVRFFDVRSA